MAGLMRKWRVGAKVAVLRRSPIRTATLGPTRHGTHPHSVRRRVGNGLGGARPCRVPLALLVRQ